MARPPPGTPGRKVVVVRTVTVLPLFSHPLSSSRSHPFAVEFFKALSLIADLSSVHPLLVTNRKNTPNDGRVIGHINDAAPDHMNDSISNSLVSSSVWENDGGGNLSMSVCLNSAFKNPVRIVHDITMPTMNVYMSIPKTLIIHLLLINSIAWQLLQATNPLPPGKFFKALSLNLFSRCGDFDDICHAPEFLCVAHYS